MKRIFNKRGDALLAMVSLSPVAAGFFGTAAILIAISQNPTIKSNFQIKKAIEKCYAEHGDRQGCVSAWEGADKTEVLAYIKDNEASGNNGNFAYGNSRI